METFTKQERLSSKIAIDNLFEKGKSFYSSPFKICWLESNEGKFPVQIVISVPKRLYKKAVDRNKIKRRIREAYRKNKQMVYEQLGQKKIHVMLIFTSKTILEYNIIEEKTIFGLKRLLKEINSEL